MACAMLAVFSIGLAAYGKPEGQKPFFVTAAPEATLALRFSDAADGSVTATDAATGRELVRLPPGEGGFVRVAMRSLTLARQKAGIGRAEPFQLSRLPGGRHVLRDPATGRAMLLDAFGRSNAGAFAAILENRGES